MITERAVKLGNKNKPWYENDASLDSLYGDARIQQLQAKIEKKINPNRFNSGKQLDLTYTFDLFSIVVL